MRRKSPRFPWIWSVVALCLAAVSLESSPADCKPPQAAAKPKKKAAKEAPAKEEKKNGKEKPAAEPAATPTTPAPAANGDSEDSRAIQRGERVEFDARLIQGQTAKAGAVYLFARVSTNLRSMVKERSSFRDKIIRSVFPTDEIAPAAAPAEAPKEKEKEKEEKKEKEEVAP